MKHGFMGYDHKTKQQVLPAFQIQVLIWAGDSGSNPEQAHGDEFLVCQ
jgi:hypothetical protein